MAREGLCPRHLPGDRAFSLITKIFVGEATKPDTDSKAPDTLISLKVDPMRQFQGAQARAKMKAKRTRGS